MDETNIRVIKKNPNKYDRTRESALNIIKEMEKDISREDITGCMSVVFLANGEYIVYGAAGLGRHQKLGVLTEMIHDLCAK